MRTEPLWQRPEVMRPMDAQPGLLTNVPHPTFGHDMNPITRLVSSEPITLASDEAEAAALALRMVLEDFENLDVACALHVWNPPETPWGPRLLDHDATRARVDAARRALAKLEGAP